MIETVAMMASAMAMLVAMAYMRLREAAREEWRGGGFSLPEPDDDDSAGHVDRQAGMAEDRAFDGDRKFLL